MNEKLKKYTEQPDPAVWQGIRKTLARRKALRRTAWGAAALVVAGAVVFFAFPRTGEPVQVAEMQPAEQVVSTALSLPATPQATAPAVEVATTRNEVKSPERAVMPAAVEEVTPTAVPAAADRQQDPTPARDQEEPSRPTAHSPQPQTLSAQPTILNSQPESNTVAEAATPAPAAMPDKAPANSGVSNVPDTLLWFPNVFAPASDNDEINRFRAQLSKEGVSLKDFRMAIYNRAGARVFYSTDLREAWDGTRDGQPLPQSAYVYVVFYTDSNGLQHHCKGTVTLVR